MIENVVQVPGWSSWEAIVGHKKLSDPGGQEGVSGGGSVRGSQCGCSLYVFVSGPPHPNDSTFDINQYPPSHWLV